MPRKSPELSAEEEETRKSMFDRLAGVNPSPSMADETAPIPMGTVIDQPTVPYGGATTTVPYGEQPMAVPYGAQPMAVPGPQPMAVPYGAQPMGGQQPVQPMAVPAYGQQPMPAQPMAVAQPMQPAQPMAVPYGQQPMAVAQPMQPMAAVAQPMAQPMAVAQPMQPAQPMAVAQPAQVVVGMAPQPQLMGRQPPPNCPPNGSYQQVKYVGNTTCIICWALVCCAGMPCGPLAFLCPCDSKEVYAVGESYYNPVTGYPDSKVGPCACT